MMRLPTLTALLPLALVACVPEAPADLNKPESIVADGLTLTVVAPDRVAGVFNDVDEDLTISFDASRVGDTVQLELRDHRQELLSIETVGDTYVTRYLDGKLTIVADKAVATMQAEEATDARMQELLTVDGDVAVFDELLHTPAMAVLPWLSRALGAEGLTGNHMPATLALHRTAKQTAMGLDIQLPPLDAVVVGDVRISTCLDLSTDPNNDGCFGMCGRDCNCWSWVCGDCCYHGGCATHDTWCRTGGFWASIACYSPAAIVALWC